MTEHRGASWRGAVLWHSIERPLAIIPTTIQVESRQFQDYNNNTKEQAAIIIPAKQQQQKMTIEYEVSSRSPAHPLTHSTLTLSHSVGLWLPQLSKQSERGAIGRKHWCG